MLLRPNPAKISNIIHRKEKAAANSSSQDSKASQKDTGDSSNQDANTNQKEDTTTQMATASMDIQAIAGVISPV